ncbi:hypothetical protein AB1Y20_003653 [Prymnesium parvum]|uniref:Mannosyltransferase n=1 Tax=Prymnesium parvum TaxID=97485 RepID=A0AB34J5C0_PRYPA
MGPLGALCWLWSATEAVLMVTQPFLAPSPAWICAVTPCLLLPALRPSLSSLTLAILARLAMHAAQAPFVWDSCYWCALSDAGILVAAACATARHGADPERRDALAVEMISLAMRWQMAIFYFAAGFWKLNTAFLDPTHSCATLVVVQLIAYWLPPALTPLPLVRLLAHAAPLKVIAGEVAIAPLLLGGHARLRQLAILLVLLLHAGICLTPFPNQIPTFSVVCLSRVLFAAAPHTCAAAINEAVQLPSTTAGIAWRSVAVATIALAASCNTNPAFVVNWSIPYYALLGCLSVLVLARFDESRGSSAADLAAWRGPWARLPLAALLGVTAFCAFGLQILGVMDGVASPFSSLRLHGGSNHLLLPTSLLQPSLGGDVVRVEASTSTYLNSLYPADITSKIDPRSREMLLAVGHTARQYNPTVRRVVGEELRAYMPRWQPDSSSPFIKYTMPAMELRRVLWEARERNESFSIEYSRLPGGQGDETWRSSSSTARVKLVENAHGKRICKVITGLWSSPCAEDEVALAPPLSAWQRRVMLFFPHAIEPGAAQLPCAD